jgi:hypothetical protein
MDVFSRVELERFVERMRAHLLAFFPEKCELMNAQELGSVIQRGILNAQQYGITSDRDVAGYIDLMILLGEDFDTDPSIPWAGEILRETRGGEPRERIGRLLSIVAGDERWTTL